MNLSWSVVLLGCLFLGCATQRVIRLDTGEGPPITYTPPKRIEPIDVEAREFQKVMTQLVLDMHFSLRSANERPQVQFALMTVEPPPAGRDYGAWCARQDSPGECLSLLDDGLTFLDAKARRKMALSFAWDGVWEGVQEAVREIINPLALKAMITSAMAAYMVLVIAPEPITKIVTIALTTYVIAYIGLDSFAALVKGWQQLSLDAESAVSFQQLEDAGERFGQVLGANGARVLILALTAALGGGAANMASKGPLLPGFARVALATETNAGYQLSAAMTGGVRSISIADGIMTVGLAPNAVAMTARGQEGGKPQQGNQASESTYENQLPERLGAELELARRLGVRPVSVDSPEFLRYASRGRIKWVVTEDGQLRVIPHTWRNREVSHTVASEGRPVRAAGEAEFSIHGATRFGIEITPRSGHYLEGASKATNDKVLDLGRRAFAEFGIKFAP